jgi:hypothetical protein
MTPPGATRRQSVYCSPCCNVIRRELALRLHRSLCWQKTRLSSRTFSPGTARQQALRMAVRRMTAGELTDSLDPSKTQSTEDEES